MAERVDIVRPTATPLEAVRAVAAAYHRLFGRAPTWPELLILAAQSSHETGRWRSMPNYNVAGLKASVQGRARYFEALTTEYVTGPDGKPKAVKVMQRFRAYERFEHGVYDWLSLLHRGYPRALEAAREGDALEFVEGLLMGWGRGAHYFTAPFPAYSAGVRSNLAWLEGLAPDLHVDLADEPETFGEQLVDRVLDELDGIDDDTFTPTGDDHDE